MAVRKPLDVQEMMLIKEEIPWSPSQDQQDPGLLHIKEEQEELLTSQEEANTTFPFTIVTVKTEDDEEKPQTIQLHQSQTEDNREPPTSSSDEQIKAETDGGDCGRPEPAKNPDPHNCLQPNIDGKPSVSLKTEVSIDDKWQEPLSRPETEDSEKPGVNSNAGRNRVEKPFSGPECDKQFLHNGSLQRHAGLQAVKRPSEMTGHTEQKPFGCDVCGQRFELNVNLKAHMKVHSGEKPFSCSFCEKNFRYQCNLKAHTRVHTKEKPFGCSMCDARYTQSIHLKTHMRIHTGEKPFVCEICHKGFSRLGILKSHMNIHTGEKLFNCDVCHKTFLQLSDLKRHKWVHSADKPFSCSVCGKKFTQRMHLKAHMSNHTGVRPFACDVCGKGFNCKRNMKTHMRVHTGEKPFGCDVCSKRFSQPGTLKRHMSIHKRTSHLEQDEPGELCAAPLGAAPATGARDGLDVQQMLQTEQQVPSSPNLDQEQLLTGCKGGQLNGLEESHITRFSTTAAPVKSEHNREQPQSSQSSQRPTEDNRVSTPRPTSCSANQGKENTDGGNCREPEPSLNPDGNSHLQPNTAGKPSGPFEIEVSVHDEWQELKSDPRPEAEDRDKGWKESGAHESGVSSDVESNPPKEYFSCSECGKQFLHKRSLRRHRKCHSSSLANEKGSTVKQNGTEEKIFRCDVCQQKFNQRSHFKIHMRIHTGEKPFCCEICGKIFRHKYSLDRHIKYHTGEKPYGCGFCSKRFSHLWDLKRHESVHTKSPRPDEPKGLGLVPTVSPPATSEVAQTQVEVDVDVQQMLPVKEESPSSPSLDQQDSKPPHIKEEQEELLTSQEGEQVKGLEEVDITRFPVTAASVKSEDDEEKPESFQLRLSPPEDDNNNKETELPTSFSAEQIKTETVEEDCGGPEPTANLDSDGHLQANADGRTSDSHETKVSSDDDWHEPLSSVRPEIEDSNEVWKDSRTYESGVNSGAGCNTAKKPFSCSECGEQSLQRHTKFHSGKESSSPLLNEERFKVKQNVDSQMTEAKLFCCDVCGQTFDKNTNLKAHVRVHTGEKPFSCSVCEKTFGHHCNLKTHMRVHTGEKPFSCCLCTKRFTQRVHLKIHMSVHTGARPFVCDVCNKGFSQLRRLKSHKSIHTGDRPFGCDACPKRFSKLGDLKRHKSVHSGEKPFKCSVCEKRFTQRIHFKTHMNTHTGERPFCCDICGKRFKCNRNLKLHVSVHTGEKPFVCDTCGKRLGCNRSLQLHMSVHTGEKPFGCGVCSKRFSQSGILKRHMRIHTGATPYGCDVCGKRFKCKGNLKTHMRVHSGEKPFVCDVCGKRLKSNSNLKNHLRVHTGDKPFGCGICDIRFNEEGSLKRHMRRRHVVVVKDL